MTILAIILIFCCLAMTIIALMAVGTVYRKEDEIQQLENKIKELNKSLGKE